MKVETGGRFECDLSEWTGIREVRVIADDAFYMPEVRMLGFARARREPVVIDVECAAALAGTVVDERAAPAGDAAVAAFAFSDGRLGARPLVETRCDDGRYRIRLPHAGSLLLLGHPPPDEDDEAKERALRDHVPGPTTAVAVLGRETAVPALQFRRGHAIAGSVVWSDGTPVAGAELGAATARADQLLHPRGVDWHRSAHGEVAHAEASATTDASGRFVIPGLGRYTHLVELRWIDRSIAFVPAAERTITAPNDRVRFVVDAAMLDVEVRTPDGAAVPTHVGVIDGGQLKKSTTNGGHMRLVLEARKE